MELTNRLLGLLLGLALLAGGLLVVVEMALAAAGRPGWIVERGAAGEVAGRLRWDDPVVLTVAAVVAVVGLLLLLLQLWPVRPRFLPVAPHAPDRRDAIDGRGLQGLIAGAAEEDQDVVGADVTVRRRKVKVTAYTPADAPRDTVRPRVEEHVRTRLDSLSLERPLSPTVRVRGSKERVR